MSSLGIRIIMTFTPAKQVEESDRRLERAQALFEKHQDVMNPHDRDLAHSLLQYSKDLRVGFEAKCLPNSRIKQAQRYCTQVDEALQKIQATVEKTDVRAIEVKSVDGG
ncbi:hypothetical protein H4582DRAFT_2060173 [Lactarius indigo]|nr:hypothetical protein H4582DRAFT_2060173 [Lactarius indigo]